MTSFAVGLLLNSPYEQPSSAGRRHWLGPLVSAPLRRLLAADALFVTAVTAVDVVLPIYAQEYQAAGFTGLYLAVLSIGSVLGSLALAVGGDLAPAGQATETMSWLSSAVLCLAALIGWRTRGPAYDTRFSGSAKACDPGTSD
ncbi:hypothetical protein AB0O76_22725 [Streptomyces sp. NPDC086554]|uniref:hypothetical protein n=1 Tax=Streptomyces sp. NPDC086554 TaxID=3154864 RepID=UPI00343C9712